MKTKRCFACGETKDTQLFYQTPSRTDGLSAHCKVCARKDAKTWRQSAKGKEFVKNYSYKRYKKFREKYLARAKVSRSLKDGKLIRPDYCSACLNDCKPHAHHEDYDKPLEVTWLCDSCHKTIHGKIIDDALKPANLTKTEEIE